MAVARGWRNEKSLNSKAMELPPNKLRLRLCWHNACLSIISISDDGILAPKFAAREGINLDVTHCPGLLHVNEPLNMSLRSPKRSHIFSSSNMGEEALTLKGHKMKFWTGLGVGLAMAVASPASAATNLITNGSFEAGFANWIVGQTGGGTAPVVITYGSANPYPGGAFGEAVLPNTVSSLSPDTVGTSMAYFSSDTASPHSLTQSINLVAGTTYNIGFDYYAPQNGINNPNNASLSFVIGGVPVGAMLNAGQPGGTPGQQWINFNTSFVAAASGPTTFAFQFQGLGVTAADFAVDRVYATAAAVPEPSTWMMLVMGFAFIGHALRRSAKAASRLAFT